MKKMNGTRNLAHKENIFSSHFQTSFLFEQNEFSDGNYFRKTLV